MSVAHAAVFTKAAALSVTRAGAQSSIPNRDEVTVFFGDGELKGLNVGSQAPATTPGDSGAM